MRSFSESGCKVVVPTLSHSPTTTPSAVGTMKSQFTGQVLPPVYPDYRFPLSIPFRVSRRPTALVYRLVGVISVPHTGPVHSPGLCRTNSKPRTSSQKDPRRSRDFRYRPSGPPHTPRPTCRSSDPYYGPLRSPCRVHVLGLPSGTGPGGHRARYLSYR